MSEFAGEKTKYQAHCEHAVAPLDADTASIVAEYLDFMIDSISEDRWHTCDEEKFSQGIHMEELIVQSEINGALSKYTVTLQHNVYRHEVRSETYDLTLYWRVLRDDVVDPGYQRRIHLMIPEGDDEVPQLLVFYDQSKVAGATSAGPANIDTFMSNEHQADRMLNKAFYLSQTAGNVAAEHLFDEMADIASLAAAQLSD